MNLVKYRDAHMNYDIYFWVINQIRVSPIYPTRGEAEAWDGTRI